MGIEITNQSYFNCPYSGDSPHPQVSAAAQGAKHHVAQLPLIREFLVANTKETFFGDSKLSLDMWRESVNLYKYGLKCSNNLCCIYMSASFWEIVLFSTVKIPKFLAKLP